jgi:hypothetical protein
MTFNAEGATGKGNVSACRRIGVSAFAKRHQFHRDLLIIIAVSKCSLPRRRLETLLFKSDWPCKFKYGK